MGKVGLSLLLESAQTLWTFMPPRQTTIYSSAVAVHTRSVWLMAVAIRLIRLGWLTLYLLRSRYIDEAYDKTNFILEHENTYTLTMYIMDCLWRYQ